MKISFFTTKMPSSTLITLFKQSLIAVVVVITLFTVAVMLLEEKFIFFPTKYPGGYYDDARLIRGRVECAIRTEDGVTLHGWFAPADSALATVVVCHGNAGNISSRIDIIRRLQEIGLNVLMFDYRGYGKSEGTPNEEGVYKDARAAYDYALTLPGVEPGNMLIWGTSLGGPIAVDLALQRPSAGLILEATFSSAAEVARAAYPYLPVSFILQSKFDAERKIRDVDVPLLQIHGALDGIIPLSLGRKVFDAANEPKEFYRIEGADHNDTYVVGGEEYFSRVRAFVERTLRLGM